MAHLTADLGRFVANLSLDSTPERARAIAKTGFADCYAVIRCRPSRTWLRHPERSPLFGFSNRFDAGGEVARAKWQPSFLKN